LDKCGRTPLVLEFSIGDRVCFEVGERNPIEGMLTRYNKKTVTVIGDDGRQWNVSPRLLRRTTSVAPSGLKRRT
jgi:hypothetical protein